MTGFDFLKPDYDAVFSQRLESLAKLQKATPQELAGVKEHYRTHPVDFIRDWGMTFDPRLDGEKRIPFIPFPRQEEFIEWVYERVRNREHGLAEKSRDMGVSWLCIAIAVHMWLFEPHATIGFGSRKEDYVDHAGNPSSLFWKARFLIDNLPPVFRPKGWDSKKHAPHLRISNPENGATIIGEAGENIGRGGRCSIYFKDESAFYEQPEKIEAALSQNSNVLIDVSTPNGSGNPFYNKRHGGRIPIFSFHWRQDPRKDEAWYEKQKSQLDAVLLAQEVDIDYSASINNSWISGTLLEDAFKNGPADVEKVGNRVIGVDAAHFGDDDCVLTFRHGRLVLPQIVIKGKIDGPDLAGRVMEWADELGNIDQIIIEKDGPGISCYDALRRSRYGNITIAVSTGAQLGDQRNYNVKARMWRRMKEWLEDQPVSMPRDGELKAEVTAMLYNYKDGRLLMEPKKDYKKRLGKSPDKADSLALTFAATDAAPPQKEITQHRRRYAGAGSWLA